MAKNNNQNLTDNNTHTFTRGLNKDTESSFVADGYWTHARNAVNNTLEGDLNALSNESSNFLCATAGATLPGEKYIIGFIHIFSDKWLVYTAAHDNNGTGPSIGSEIGLFEERICKYRPIVQDTCLGFSKWHLISGASREREDCSWSAYWADGNNPDRYINIGDPSLWPGDGFLWQSNNTYANAAGQVIQWPGVAWVQNCNVDDNNCTFCENTTELDCDKLRLARLVTTPCIQVNPGRAGGALANGSYFATIAYAIRGERVTNWFSLSNVQPIFVDNEPGGALEITVSADQDNFDEFILCVVAVINQQTVAKQFGIYNTSTNSINIDIISDELVTIPINDLPLQVPVYEKSDQIAEVNNYLLRVGPTTKFDFNYQPLANLIRANWVSVQYPSDYYMKGGYKPGYMRDEVYAFFIRWVYDTGDKSASYHIPGRVSQDYTDPCFGVSAPENQLLADQNSIFSAEKTFEIYNTAPAPSSFATSTLDDGGLVLSRGRMAYWESTETYPANRPDIWNASSYCWTGVPCDPVTQQPLSSPAYDLCGLPIRHHKFPDNALHSTVHHFTKDSANDDQLYIRLMGVEFENIIYPKDNDGNDIPGIVGYEILRGSREGNRTIMAKGMINNMRPYKVKGNNNNNKLGLYPNHPFNTITPFYPDDQGIPTGDIPDPYIIYDKQEPNDPLIAPRLWPPINPTIDQLPSNIVTFHSPDLNISRPFLSMPELKIYGNIRGISNQAFVEPNKHPQHKLIANASLWVMLVAGTIEAIIAKVGKRTLNTPGAEYSRDFLTKTTGGNATNTINGTSGVYGVAFTTPPSNINTQIIFNEYEITDQSPSDYQDFRDNKLGTGASPNTGSFNEEFNEYLQGGALDERIGTGTSLQEIYDKFNLDGGLLKGGTYTAPVLVTELSNNQYIEGSSGFFTFINQYVPNFSQLLYYFSEGADFALRLIYALLPNRQYALQMQAHGLYDEFYKYVCHSDIRFRVEDSFYLNNTIQDMKPFNTPANLQYRINNINRQNTVVVRTTNGAGSHVGPYFINEDNSLLTIGTAAGQDLLNNGNPASVNFDNDSKINEFNAKIASHYAALKFRLVNQYGQLNSIKQLPVTPCEQKFTYEDLPREIYGPTICCPQQYERKVIARTPVFFGGDTYINRYTEKNNMFFFSRWLFGEPNGFEYNYYNYQALPEPRFWMNSEKYEVSALYPGTAWLNPLPGTGVLPNAYYTLDTDKYMYQTNEVPDGAGLLWPTVDGYPGIFGVKESYFYLATSAIRDFFVESEVIVDFRKAGFEQYQKHYDPYRFTDLSTLLDINPDNITKGNYYSYDYSLSITRLFTQFFSQGNLQSRYYNPVVSELCYTYYPDRIIYSLPQQDESLKDSWFIYLANNYKEFKDQISGVKNFAKTGIFITFKNSSPLIFQGVDQLETEFGTKITIGDGGLFSQTPQAVSVADKQYEYGSSQNRLSVISTPAGMFYVSQNQGKVFTFSGGLSEASQNGMKWWFSEFLPYKLLIDFPDYPHTDNPVAGIGCQSIYDNESTVLYISKRDFKLREQYKGLIKYNPKTNEFLYGNRTTVKLGDSTFFEDASWTVSYDPKSQFWISFHDWHPNLTLPTKNTFLSTKGNTIWKHNETCNSFCNFYGIDYPFEIELPIVNGQTVTTLRSVEYMLECYKKSRFNCVDQFHVLDYNFDKAVIYNTEQVSGVLNLNIYPKNNVALSQQYPIVNLNTIDILFSKEENKYRFNQFWDITRNRGEFPIGSAYPPTTPVIPGTTVLPGPYDTEQIWVTQANGYIKTLNQANLNYNKTELERKRFRHYINFVNLSKEVSGDVNMILKILNTKNTYSPR